MNNPLLNALNGAQAQPEVAPSIFPVARPAKPQTPAQRQRMLNQTMQGPTVSPLQRAMMPNVAPVRRDTTPPALRVLPEYDFHRIAYGAENEQEKRDIMRREALTRRSNPNSLESVMASADKRLGTKQGDEVRELIKSFAWIRSGGINRGGLKAYVDEGIKRFEEQGIDSLRSFVETGRRYRDVDPTPREGDDPELARAQYLKQSALQAQADLREGTPADVRQGVIDTGSSPQFGDAIATGVYNTNPLAMIGQGVRAMQGNPTVAMASEYGQNLAVDKPHMGEDPGLIALGVFNDFLAPASRAYRQTIGPVSSANEGTQLGLQIGDFVGQIAVAAALPQTAAQGIAKLPEIGARFAAMDLPQYGEMVASSKGNAGKAATDFMEATFGQFAHAPKLLDPKVPWSEKGHIALGMLQGSLLLAGALAGQPNRTAKAPLIQRIAKFLKLSGKDDSVVIAGQAKDAMETSMRFLGENADNPEVQAGIAQAINEPAPVDTSFRPSGRNVDPEQSFQKTIRVGSSGAEINSKAHPGVTTKVDLTPEENVWIAKTENLSPREIHEAWATPEGQAIAKKINDAESAADHAPAKVGDIVSGHNGASEVSGPVVEIFNGKYVVEDSVSGKQKVLEADQITSLERKAPAKPSPFSAEDPNPYPKAPKGQKPKAPKEPPPDIQTPVAETKPSPETEAGGKRYTYRLTQRPAGGSTTPEIQGRLIEAGANTLNNQGVMDYGKVSYPRPLTGAELDAFSLVPDIEGVSTPTIRKMAGATYSVNATHTERMASRAWDKPTIDELRSRLNEFDALKSKMNGARLSDADQARYKELWTSFGKGDSALIEDYRNAIRVADKDLEPGATIAEGTSSAGKSGMALTDRGTADGEPLAPGSKPSPVPPTKPVEANVGAAKESWQMTREEFVRAKAKFKKSETHGGMVEENPFSWSALQLSLKMRQLSGKSFDAKEYVKQFADKDLVAAGAQYALDNIAKEDFPKTHSNISAILKEAERMGARTDKAHQNLVSKALSEGKPVPAEVLRDYPDIQPKAQKVETVSTPEQSSIAVVRENTNDKTRTAPKKASENGGDLDVGNPRQYYKRGIKGNLEPATNATPYGAKTPPGLDLFTYRETVGEGKNRKSYTVIADARTGAEITRGAHLTSADAGLKAIVDAKGVDAILKRIDEYATKHGESPSYQKPNPTPTTPKRTAQTKAELAKAFDDFKAETQKLGARRTPEQQAKELELTINLAKKAVAHGIATVEEFIQAAATHFGTTYTKAEQAVFRKAWEQVQPKQETAVAPGKATGLARQFEDPERAIRELDPTMSPIETAEQLAKYAEAEYTPIKAKAELDRVVNGDEPTARGSAIVTYHKRELFNQSNELYSKIDSGKGDLTENLLQLNAVNAELDQIGNYAQSLRTKFAQSGHALQLAYEPDYTRASLMMRARAANLGEKLSPQIEAQLSEMAARLERAETALAKIKQEKVSISPAKNPVATRAKMLGALADLGIKVRTEEGAPQKSAAGGMKGGKQAGAITAPDTRTVENKIKGIIRTLAKSYVVEGEHSLSDIVGKISKDVPGLSQDQILRYLHEPYERVADAAYIEKRKINESMRMLQRDAERRSWSLIQKSGHWASQILGTTSRQLKAGMDLSAALLQGGRLVLTKEWAQSLAPMLKGLTARNADEFLASQNARMAASPFYAKAVKSGLGLTEGHGSFYKAEELWGGEVIDMIAKTKGIGKLVAPLKNSEAAFVSFTNNLRFELFQNLARLDPENSAYLKDVAMMINVMTGRGHGKVANALGSEVGGTLLFAPRYAFSQFQAAGGVPVLASKTGLGRRQALQLYGRQIAFMGTAIALTLAQGGSVDNDPRSTNYGKLKLRDGTEIDIFGKWLQPYRLLAQLSSGSISEKGKYTPPSGYAAAGVAGRFVIGKLSPASKLAWSVLTEFKAPNDEGKWVDMDRNQILADMVTPISMGNVVKRWDKVGPISAAQLLGPDIDKAKERNSSYVPPMQLPKGLKQLMGTK